VVSLYSVGEGEFTLKSELTNSVGGDYRILTGWEITQDILRQLKELGVDNLAEDMGYDELLEALGKTRAERNMFIRGYFEPTPDEQSHGLKTPSQAHRAIANLVKDGYIKVILTTNFDRLLEIALEDIGITPDVIRSDNMLKGMPPIRHAAITIIQLHGDYRDIGTLNTANELEVYSPEKNEFLDTILAEYGLVVCGWSAKWDKALRDAIFRIKPRWYSSYWVEPRQLSQEAQDVIRHRRADVIVVTADEFFADLQGKVEALVKLNRQHPLSIAVAVEQVKKFLPRDETQIQLEDLLREESERAYQQFSALALVRPRSSSKHEVDLFYKDCISNCMTIFEVVLNMITAVCWYGKGQQAEVLTTLLTRWATPENIHQESNHLRRLPSLLLVYVGGMVALYKSNWAYLQALLLEPKITSFRNARRLAVLEEVMKNVIFETNIYKDSFHRHDALSQRLKSALHPIFGRYFPIVQDYRDLFDLFEMLLALILASREDGSWIGHDAIMGDYRTEEMWDYIIDFWVQGAKQGKDWDFLKTFFNGDRNQLEAALTTYHARSMKTQTWHPKLEIPDYGEIYKTAFFDGG
jgi:hypothetical protein